MKEMSIGPFCQSCGMPMEKSEDFGTDDKRFRINDYCHYCYQNGKFTEDISKEEMIDKVSKIMAEKNIMPEEEAKEMMGKCIPKIKRWM